jgi:hypothetical protein
VRRGIVLLASVILAAGCGAHGGKDQPNGASAPSVAELGSEFRKVDEAFMSLLLPNTMARLSPRTQMVDKRQDLLRGFRQ